MGTRDQPGKGPQRSLGATTGDRCPISPNLDGLAPADAFRYGRPFLRRNRSVGIRHNPLVDRTELLDQLWALHEEHDPERLFMCQVLDLWVANS